MLIFNWEKCSRLGTSSWFRSSSSLWRSFHPTIKHLIVRSFQRVFRKLPTIDVTQTLIIIIWVQTFLRILDHSTGCNSMTTANKRLQLLAALIPFFVLCKFIDRELCPLVCRAALIYAAVSQLAHTRARPTPIFSPQLDRVSLRTDWASPVNSRACVRVAWKIIFLIFFSLRLDKFYYSVTIVSTDDITEIESTN